MNISSRTLLKITFFTLAALCFSTALISSYKAPGFFGKNFVADIPFWKDQDPGAWYIQSAHELMRKPPVFAGHPGIPMQLGNALIQNLVYFIFHGENESYTSCIVRKLYVVQVLSKTMTSLTWLVAAWLLTLLTGKLFRFSP